MERITKTHIDAATVTMVTIPQTFAEKQIIYTFMHGRRKAKLI